MTGFVQVVEYSTSRIEDVQQLQDEWRGRFPEMGPSRVTVCADRAQPGRYLAIVEFASFDEAMRNSEDPSTQEFSQRMQALCDGPAVFRDLDVLTTEIRVTGARAGKPC